MPMKENKIKVGWFAFEGNKFSPNPYAYSNCLGVVAWLNSNKFARKGKRGLILIPKEIEAVWSNEYCEVDVTDKNDGYCNTQKILAYGRAYQIKFSAAEWCATYSKNGIKSGTVFMPAQNQLKKMMRHREDINEALSQIRGDLLKDWCWSSTSFKNTLLKMILAKLKNLLALLGLRKNKFPRPYSNSQLAAMIVYPDGMAIALVKSYKEKVRAVMAF